MRRRRFAAVAVVLAVLVALGATAAVRATAAPPAPHIALQTGGDLSVGGSPPSITVPIHGTLALVAEGRDLVSSPMPLVADAADEVHPIASVAKTLTALVVLGKMPLGPSDSGPEYTIDAQDVTYYVNAVALGGSSTFVSRGEQFSERQLLEALMLPSGNNIADTLAVWVAGSIAAFVGLENAAADALGMRHTTITDPSGFDAGTQSTASDLLRLGAAAIANPALGSIVGERHLTLPSGQTVPNFDTALSQPGWLGIKTGDSAAAGGCFLFAARRAPAGDDDPADAFVLIGAILDDRSLLSGATGDDDRAAAIYDSERAVDSAVRGMTAVRAQGLSSAPRVSGSVTTAWSGTAPLPLHLGAARVSRSVVVRSGTSVSLATRTMQVAVPAAGGSQVGSVTLRVGGSDALVWPVLTSAAITGPDLVWRLQHD